MSEGSSRPLDEDIERVLCVRDECTYVIKNMLRGKYPGITTPKVRRRLIALERAGLVKRVPNPYSAVHQQWSLV